MRKQEAFSSSLCMSFTCRQRDVITKGITKRTFGIIRSRFLQQDIWIVLDKSLNKC